MCKYLFSNRDGSVQDLRASSGDLTKIGSNNETLSAASNQYEASRFQSGVLRTNCIDCLDRTNVAQYAYGLAALGRQLHAMGLTNMPKVDPDSSIAAALMDMYQSMGDALAQQYGGSAAHNTVLTCMDLSSYKFIYILRQLSFLTNKCSFTNLGVS